MNHSKADQKCREKTIPIIVNGRPREIEKSKRDLSYLEIVDLAFPGEVPTENIVFTVTYSTMHGRDGVLVEGQSVKVKKEMIFNVRKTDKS